jgi:hypothetical protein
VTRIVRSFLAALAGIVLAAASLQPAPKAQLWERWVDSDQASTTVVDHAAWERFLNRYLVAPGPGGVNRLRYGEVSPEDRAALRAYLESLQRVAVSRLNRAEQMAYWINLYNALTVEVVLDHYPVTSITKINLGGRLLGGGPWDAKLVRIEGEQVSLNDIEHRILRPIWRDPRVHYAVNCASLGCPNLQGTAYTRANLEVLLEKGAREYVRHPRGARFEGERLIASSIFSWFQEDFGGTTAGVLEHLALYSDPQAAERLRAYRGSIRYDYDWSLNAP